VLDKQQDVIELDAYKARFDDLALKKGLCKPDELAKVHQYYGQHPAFFVYMCEVLESRSKPFGIIHELNSAIISVPGYDPGVVTEVVEWLRVTRPIRDNDKFDKVWKTCRDHSDRYVFKGVPVEAGLARILKVLDLFYSMFPANEYFPTGRFAIMETIINYSHDVQHDMKMLRSSTHLDGDQLSYSADAESLKEYYEAGHHYICHAKFFDKPRYQGGEDDIVGRTESMNEYERMEMAEERQRIKEIELGEPIAKWKKYPDYKFQKKIITAMCEIPVALRLQLLNILKIFAEDDIPLQYYETLVDVCANGKKEVESQDPLIRIIISMDGFSDEETMINAMFVLEDLLKEGSNLAQYVDNFERHDIESIAREIYSRKLAEHAKKFPEKPIDQLRKEFLTPENVDSEIPPEANIDKAFALYQQILSAGEELIPLPTSEVIHRMQACAKRGEAANGSDEYKVKFFALSRELFKREFGVYPYNTQVISILLLLDEDLLKSGQEGKVDNKGVYSQIKTGEGKSLLLSLLSSYLGVHGRKVDVITSNEYLAKRDAMKFGRFYKYFNLSTNSFKHAKSGADVMKASPAVMYTTNHDMIFSFLTCRLNGQPFFSGERFDVCLIDEADNLCIDMGQDSCRIAEPAEPLFSEEIFRSFLSFVDIHGNAIYEDMPTAIDEFKKYCPEVQEIHPIYIGLYLRSAMNSKDQIQGEDFVVIEDAIVIVDVKNTGRLKEKTHWEHGLHEFVALRQGLKLPQHFGVAADMNHPTFVRKYKNMYCISGTMGDSVDRSEIQEVYSITGFDVPSHYPSRRVDEPLSLTFGLDEFKTKILEKVQRRSSEGAPVLLLTQSITESEMFYNLLKEAGLKCQLLNDVNNCDYNGEKQHEDSMIKNAGQTGMITVATSVAGRGADIIPDAEATKAGGLHSILTFIPFNKRVEFQNRGRAGRQGNPGISEIIACAETDLFLRELPNPIKESIKTLAGKFENNTQAVQMIIEFLRRAINLMASLRRRFEYEKDTIIQEALDKYFATMSIAGTKLSSANFAIGMNSGLATYLFSLYVGQSWAKEYDYVQNVIKFENVIELRRPTEMKKPPESDEKSEYIHKLEECYRLSFGVDLDERVPANNNFWLLAMSLFEIYAVNINNTERRMKEFDSNIAIRITRELQKKVDAMADKFYEKFKLATVTDINVFLAEKKKETDERNGPKEKDRDHENV